MSKNIDPQLAARRENVYQVISHAMESFEMSDKLNLPQDGYGVSDLSEKRPLMIDPRKAIDAKDSEIVFYAKGSGRKTQENLQQNLNRVKETLEIETGIKSEVRTDPGYANPITALVIDINQDEFDKNIAALSSWLKDSTQREKAQLLTMGTQAPNLPG